MTNKWIWIIAGVIVLALVIDIIVMIATRNKPKKEIGPKNEQKIQGRTKDRDAYVHANRIPEDAMKTNVQANAGLNTVSAAPQLDPAALSQLTAAMQSALTTGLTSALDAIDTGAMTSEQLESLSAVRASLSDGDFGSQG